MAQNLIHHTYTDHETWSQPLAGLMQIVGVYDPTQDRGFCFMHLSQFESRTAIMEHMDAENHTIVAPARWTEFNN